MKLFADIILLLIFLHDGYK